MVIVLPNELFDSAAYTKPIVAVTMSPAATSKRAMTAPIAVAVRVVRGMFKG
jgi:hypothetical protein